MPKRIAVIFLLALGVGGPWVNGSKADELTDPVGFFTITFPGDSQFVFSVGLVNAVEYFNSVSAVSGDTVSLLGEADPDRLPGGGHFSVRSGATAGLNIDAKSVTTNSPGHTEITLSTAVDGLVSIGDVVTLRRHTTLADFFGSNNEAGLKVGTSVELADNIAIWDGDLQTSRVFYWHTSDGFVEAGKEFEGDKSSVPIRFPSGAVFTRRDASDLSFTRAGHVLVPSEQQIFPVKNGTNILACSLWISDVTSFQFSDYGLYESGSPFSVRAGTAAPQADVMIHTGMETGLISDPIYFQSDAGGGHWQFVGGGDAGNHPVNGFATLQLFRAGPVGFIKFDGTSIAPATDPKVLAAADVDVLFDLAISDHDQYALTWLSRDPATYQIQTRPDPTSPWTNSGTPITASGGEISKTVTLAGSGRIRIIEK